MKKYLKILLSLTLIVALTLPAFGVMGASNTASGLNSDEIQLLRNLGIVPEGAIQRTVPITRGELAHIAAKVCGATDLISVAAESAFYDVPAGHKYYNDINALMSLGVLTGDGSGYFFPDNIATYGEACKMFSMILGYVSIDTASYVKIAKQLGVIDSMILGTEELTYGSAIEIAHNTLHSRMLTTDVFGEHVRYTTMDDCIALEYYHGLVVGTGVLEGVRGTTLTRVDDTLEKDEVLINGQIFRYQEGRDLLGKSVVYYYNKSDEKLPTIDIQYIYANPEFNTTLEINPDDIVGIVGDTLTYYVGDNKKEVVITGETDVIYNGIAFPNWTEDDFKPAEGSVILLNNDIDREYEVAFIESYEYAISGTVDAVNNVIYCKYPTNKIIGSGDSSAMIEYYNQGRLAYFGGLGADVPLIIKESKNTEGAKIVKIETFKETVTGAIESKTADSIKINGKVYKLSNIYYEDSAVRLGETVTAYIHNNKCAMILHEAAPGYTVAYLLGVGKNEEAFSEHLSIYVREENKAKVEYDCIEKVKIDGNVVSDADVAMTKLREAAAQTYQTADSDWPYSQFIRYKKNDEGLITHIDTLTYNEGKEGEDSLNMFKSMEEDGEQGALLRRYFAAVRGWHDTATGEIDFILPTTAKLYWVPSARDNENFFRNNHSFINRGDYTIEAYNVDPYTRKAEYAIIYYTPGVSVDVSGVPYIIEDIATSINDKEEVVYEIGLTGSSTATYFCSSDVNNAGYLEVGNVVQVALNESGEVINVARKHDITQEPTVGSTEEYSSGSTDPYYAALRMTYGTVVEFNAEHIFLASSVATNVSGDVECEELCAYAIPGKLPIFIFNREKNIVESGSTADIISYHTNRYEATNVLAVVTGGTLKYLYIVD